MQLKKGDVVTRNGDLFKVVMKDDEFVLLAEMDIHTRDGNVYHTAYTTNLQLYDADENFNELGFAKNVL